MRDREEKKETERALENNEDQSKIILKKKRKLILCYLPAQFSDHAPSTSLRTRTNFPS